jgi:hypothetical protein
VVAQVTALVGAGVLMLAIGLSWTVYNATSGGVDSLLSQLDAVTSEAVGTYDAVATALDDLAGVAANPDAQALLQDGADLVRGVGDQVASIESQIGDLVDSLLTTLLVVLGLLTALLAYLVVIHGGIWTLGRHWRRD